MVDSPNDLMRQLEIISDELDAVQDGVTVAQKKASTAMLFGAGALLLSVAAVMGTARLIRQLQPIVAMGQQMQQAMAPMPMGPAKNGTVPTHTGISETPIETPLPKGEPVGNKVPQDGPSIPDVIPMPDEPDFSE